MGDNVEVGVYRLPKAIALSEELELDLVEISPKASPPVCNILDYKKFLYEQKKREMLDSVETRFYACDPDNDNTLDVYETTVCLPQVARQFRYVDINNDNVISLDELSILAKDFHNKINKMDQH